MYAIIYSKLKQLGEVSFSHDSHLQSLISKLFTHNQYPVVFESLLCCFVQTGVAKVCDTLMGSSYEAAIWHINESLLILFFYSVSTK